MIMAADITLAVTGVAINNVRAVCSTLPTGQTAKLLLEPNYPLNLTIENIEYKYDNKFDEINYYVCCSGAN